MSEKQFDSNTLLEVRGLKEYFDINMGFFRSRPLKAVISTVPSGSSAQV